jgi:3-hydroxyisobutyrate dehydrogenase-like beta-hydroxyacid dehydrogenase
MADPITGAVTGAVSGALNAGSGGSEADFDKLQAIFDQAKADQLRITEISVKGNTGIAQFKEKPKI